MVRRVPGCAAKKYTSTQQQCTEPGGLVRHYCDLADGLQAWGWHEHDGEGFGRQRIEDGENNLKLDIAFMLQSKGIAAVPLHGQTHIIPDEWSAEIKLSPLDAQKPFNVALIHYIADEHANGHMHWESKGSSTIIQSQDAPSFYLRMRCDAPSGVYGLQAEPQVVWDATRLLMPYLGFDPTGKGAQGRNNFVGVQYKLNATGVLDIAFSGKPNSLPAPEYGSRSNVFDQRFQTTFPAIAPSAQAACKYALSNLLGGISYFFGTSYVLKDGDFEEAVVETEPFELFTDIPSRATFPRGFFWDSGFHNLLISEWSPGLSLEILESWANRIEHNGWVAREQVPGLEARRAVPVGYIIQNTKHANPPALLLTVLKLARQAKVSAGKKHVMHKLRHIVPQFEKNIKWLIRTQRGQIHPHFCKLMKNHRPCSRVLKLPAFRWRGRSKYHNLNSGLDDYPRSDFANKYELHVDLACWVAFGSKAMLELYELLEVRGHRKQKLLFKRVYQRVMFSLDHLHWDHRHQVYSDLSISCSGDLIHVQHQGYVNLFPLIFGFIPRDSPKLKTSLDLIEDRSRLWTDYGLRSLSKQDPYYMKGDQYWTGPIWININYLVLAALHKHYMDPSGAHAEQARRIYTQLRLNILENMVRVHRATGFLWEQYSDVDGAGLRSHPFTGWSALLVLIASEKY